MYIIYNQYQSNADFTDALTYCISQLDSKRSYIRLVFFSSPASADIYKQQYEIIKEKIRSHFGSQSPSFSFIAQPPLGDCSLIMETQSAVCSNNETINYKQHNDFSYVVIEDNKRKAVFVSGLREMTYCVSPIKQATTAFRLLEEIIAIENLSFQEIARQWNYIEDITGFDINIQRYQAFNDVRSDYYGKVEWKNGYPAATGIGTQKGGIIIDADILSGYDTLAIDNPLQIAAYVYSEKVLIGDNQYKSTPKFERARKVVDTTANKDWVYISGTAAIHGEETLVSDIEQQTLMTISNIEQMVQDKTQYMRVYIKYPKDYKKAKNILVEKYPQAEIMYVVSNVCRENLLIEIEGIAYN